VDFGRDVIYIFTVTDIDINTHVIAVNENELCGEGVMGMTEH
jgi:hypothetical protein